MTERVDGHTAGPWGVAVGKDGGFTICPADDETSYWCLANRTEWDRAEMSEANGRLFALAPTAPHQCDVPNCTGDANRRRLELLAEIVAGLREVEARDDDRGALAPDPEWVSHVLAKADALEGR